MYHPTDEERKQAENACTPGTTVEELAEQLGIDVKVCRREYAGIIAKAQAKMRKNLKVAGYKAAMNGNTQVLIFMLDRVCGITKPEPNVSVVVDRPEQIIFQVQARPSATTAND